QLAWTDPGRCAASQAGQISAPYAAGADVHGTLYAGGFAQKATDVGAVRNLQPADAQGRGNAGDKIAEALDGHAPDFDVDGRALPGLHTYQSGTRRRSTGQRVQAVAGR